MALDLASWDLGGPDSATAYRRPDAVFAGVDIPAGPSALDLPADGQDGIGNLVLEFPDGPVRLDEHVRRGPVDGIVILVRGRIVYERYPRMAPTDRHLLMSVSKVVAATLIGILEERGQLDIRQRVDAILPVLGPSGWAGTPVRDVIDMASGIGCPEVDADGAYDDPTSCFYAFESTLDWRPRSPRTTGRSTYDFVAGLGRSRPAGIRYEYTSVNTFVLAWIAERVTGQPYHEAVAREIWTRIGAEAPAWLCRSAEGAPVAHGGLAVTLRDLARFGAQFTPSAPTLDGRPIVSPGHVHRIVKDGRPGLLAARRPEVDLAEAAGRADPDAALHAGRQWNQVWADGDMFKGGFGGQGLFVSPRRDLVIAFLGTPARDGTTNRLRGVARSLAEAVASHLQLSADRP